MPKKSKINPEELIEVIKKYNDFDENTNSLKGPTQDCWSRIQTDLNNIIDAKYIYTIVLLNRYGVADKIGKNKQNLSHVFEDDNTLLSLDGNESPDNILINSSENEDLVNILHFNITLSSDE
jgi:hypothetical protein